jgi:hypothetical protein
MGTHVVADVLVGVLDRSGLYLVTALIVVPLLVLSAVLLRVVRRRARSAGQALAAELEADPPLLGPEQVVARPVVGEVPPVAGNGVLALSPTRLFFRTSTGAGVDIPTVDAAGVRLAESVDGKAEPGRIHVVVATTAGERAFLVDDGHRWHKAIDKARSAPEGRGT